MKYFYLILLFISLSNCKTDNNQNVEESIKDISDSEVKETITVDTIQSVDKDIQPSEKAISIKLKQKSLIEKPDERETFQSLIIDKSYVVNKDNYIINFKYPLLNATLKPTHAKFNEFINDYYVNIAKTESDILESKLLCDSIESLTFREERFIDYKIYIANDQLVSVLFYKENFYSGAMHSSFSFDGFNFDLIKGKFMTYEDFFIEGSEDELLVILNEKIRQKAKEGELYYDCWELSTDDFFEGKNNFVLNDTNLEFYFDDCVMCPSYTGTYSIEIPLSDLKVVLKKYEANPLLMQ